MILMYTYYFDEESCILYKSTGGACVEEYIEKGEWNLTGSDRIKGLKALTEEEADDIIKEIEGDEYDLVDGYVLEDFSGEV